jgi:hypothetical protein
MICEVDEPESAFPSAKTTSGETFLSAELRDCQTAARLAADALAPECIERDDLYPL